jgi:MFS superfamily sulfate permease-like transporter
LPLCLGIALASAPPLAGVISGIVGGIVVGYLSQSHISVSGPSRINSNCLTAITELGSLTHFVSSFNSWCYSISIGYLKAGYFQLLSKQRN